MKSKSRAVRRTLVASTLATILASAGTATALAVPAPTVETPAPTTDLHPLPFDPSLPFEVVPGGDSVETHVDTVDEQPLSPQEVEAVFARAEFDASPGMALATTTNTFHWRNSSDPNNPANPDILIEADANVPSVVIDLLGEVFVDWRSVIDLDIPAPEWHHVRVAWSDQLPTGVLGGAATGWVTVNQNGSTFVVPRFLANVNGASTASGAYALDLVLNSQINWDYTLDPNDSAPNDNYYLKTVLLHEVGHSLGVASGVDREQSIDSSVLSTWGATFFGNQSASQSFASLRSDVVRTNNLWSMNTDGTWEKIYDPSTWSTGSSLSHLDENTYTYQRGQYRTPGALMTPFLTNGEVNHVDGVIAGLLSQAGYETFLSPAAPLVSGSTTNGVLTVNITPGFNAEMNVPAKQWLVTLKDPSGNVVRQSTLPATARSVEFGGFTTSGTYTAVVTAEIDGQTATANGVGIGYSPVERTTVAQAGSLFGVIYATDYRASDADTLRLYRAFFERDPDLVGIKYWIDQSRNGTSYDDMAYSFAYSQEFTTRYSNLTDRQFLEVVYRNVLGRAPDQAGFDYWYNEILKGLPRHLTVRWVAGSTEFSNRFAYLPQ
ncbi:MAG: DUF4214 domain-containing protein [Acidimicrobiales bacterium]